MRYWVYTVRLRPNGLPASFSAVFPPLIILILTDSSTNMRVFFEILIPLRLPYFALLKNRRKIWCRLDFSGSLNQSYNYIDPQV